MTDPATTKLVSELTAKTDALRSVTGAGWDKDAVLWLAGAVLGLAFLSLLLGSLLLWRNKSEGDHVLRLFGIVIIVTLSTLLVIVGYSNEQLTPVIGLFGAIAGYLLGRSTSPSPTTHRHPPASPPPIPGPPSASA